MKSALGLKIDRLQVEKGVSTVELADKMGIQRNNVAALKRTKKPCFKTLHKLVKVFGVPVDEFLPFVHGSKSANTGH